MDFGGFFKLLDGVFFPFLKFIPALSRLAPGNNGIGGCTGNFYIAASMGFGVLGKEYGDSAVKNVMVNGEVSD